MPQSADDKSRVEAADLMGHGVYDRRWARLAACCSFLSRVRSVADLALGIVDASLIALTERLGEEKVATLDHRHFSVVRPARTEALTLLPSEPHVPRWMTS
jgi:hypothetical protein